MKYIVETGDCTTIAVFNTEKERDTWTKRNCWFDGIHWLLKDLSHFDIALHGRVVYWYEE